MNSLDIDKIKYKVFDPAKNITLLVETVIPVLDQPEVARELMKKEEKVEQVGFISQDDVGDITLRMAGGEFCGNATMCTAVYQAIKEVKDKATVKIHILDMNKTIDVDVKRENDASWLCRETLPYTPKISYIDIDEFKQLPLVSLDGISHVVFEKCNDANKTCRSEHCESVIREVCDKLNLTTLGFMFYNKEKSELTPLVYVKESDTLFWENACASGTIAVGAYLAEKEKKPIDFNLIQPGGILRVLVDSSGKISLEGKVKLL